MVTTFLTGSRPQLLEMTLESIENYCPEILYKTVIFNNAGDKPSADVIKKYNFDEVITNYYTMPIGTAVSLLAMKAYESGEKYWMIMEDDWEATSSGWYDQALELIKRPDISQIKLRLNSEPVLRTHMITGEPMVWEQRDGYKYCEKSHLTFNPSIIKTKDIPKIFPCTGERDAQKNFLPHMKGVAQLTPGVFKHIGDESLRLKTRCEV